MPADSPIGSIKDLVEHAKANPGQFTYGSPGVGTSPHLAVEEFALRAGIKLNHVPFKGTSELMQGINELGFDAVADSPFGVAGARDLDPQAVKVLHDAFRKAIEDPGVTKMLERYDQPVMYMSASDYTAWAKQTFEAERATIDRLGMKGSL